VFSSASGLPKIEKKIFVKLKMKVPLHLFTFYI
jgi:hypothetical protein